MRRLRWLIGALPRWGTGDATAAIGDTSAASAV
jgi:hypothetical protein